MLKITIRRSGYLTWLLLLAHVGAMVLLWPLSLPAWVKLLIVLALATSLAYFLAGVALLATPQAVLAVEIRQTGEIAIQTRRGAWCACRLSASSYVTPWLTILVLTEAGRRGTRYVVITPDNVDAESFRRLRVWLRWAAQRIAQAG